MTSEVYPSGPDPRKKVHKGMKSVVEDWIIIRIDDVKKYGRTVILHDRKTVNTIFYEVRDTLTKLGYTNITKKQREMITASYIKDICNKHHYKRAELGIIASDKAQLYFNGVTHDVGLKEMQDVALNLKGKGCDLIIIEKEGVVEALGPFADMYGIALMYTRGFASEYAKELIDHALDDGAKLWLITDYDIGGLSIWLDIIKECPSVKRIAVDFEILEYLHNTSDLRPNSEIVKRFTEEYNLKVVKDKKTGILKDVKDTHLTHLYNMFGADNPHIRYLEPVKGGNARRRIEIDKILKEAGNERFWEYIIFKIGLLRRNLNRSIDVDEQAKILFSEMETLEEMLENARLNILKDTIAEKKKEFSNYIGIISDVPKERQTITNNYATEMRDNTNFKSLLLQVKTLTDSYKNKAIFKEPKK